MLVKIVKYFLFESMAAGDQSIKLLFEGDFIVAQTEVIFFKKKKSKKKKKNKPQRCILLITRDQVALTNPNTNKPVVMFPRNTITNFRHNDVNDVDFDQYKLELSVLIGDKTHILCIEFPTDDAQQQRSEFIKHFTEDKAKPIPTQNNNQIPQSTPSQSQKPIKSQAAKPNVATQSNGTTNNSTNNNTPNQSPSSSLSVIY